MSKSTIVSVVSVMLLAGCASDSMMSPALELSQSAGSAASVSRPFKGTCLLTSSEVVFTGPLTATLTGAGTCTLTHLGQATISVEELLDFGALTYSNMSTVTAANGDVLELQLDGLFTPSAAGFTLAGTAVVNGGTGRFTNATGSAVHTAIITVSGPTTATGRYAFDGRITY